MRPSNGRKCSLPDTRQVAPCEWNTANWARPDSNYLQCNFINQKVLTSNILQSVVPPGNTKRNGWNQKKLYFWWTKCYPYSNEKVLNIQKSLGIVLGTGHYIRKQDLKGMLDQIKTSLEKLYLKNVNFSSGETITSIPLTDKLKSGTYFINSKLFIRPSKLPL